MKSTLHKKSYNQSNADVAKLLFLLLFFSVFAIAVAMAVQAQSVYSSLGGF
ncbi:MAG: hypothetical protein ACRC1M_06680 [Methanobacteriaceae archaeon]